PFEDRRSTFEQLGGQRTLVERRSQDQRLTTEARARQLEGGRPRRQVALLVKARLREGERFSQLRHSSVEIIGGEHHPSETDKIWVRAGLRRLAAEHLEQDAGRGLLGDRPQKDWLVVALGGREGDVGRV